MKGEDRVDVVGDEDGEGAVSQLEGAQGGAGGGRRGGGGGRGREVRPGGVQVEGGGDAGELEVDGGEAAQELAPVPADLDLARGDARGAVGVGGAGTQALDADLAGPQAQVDVVDGDGDAEAGAEASLELARDDAGRGEAQRDEDEERGGADEPPATAAARRRWWLGARQRGELAIDRWPRWPALRS